MRDNETNPEKRPDLQASTERLSVGLSTDPIEPTIRILWIDRNPHDIQLAQLVLARLAPEFELQGAHSHADLGEEVARRDFDLAVVGDIEAAPAEAALALNRALPGVPVLLFSEIAPRRGLELLRSGFDDFLPKASRSFLELPQFLVKALGRGEERQRTVRRETRLSRLLDHCAIGAFRCEPDGALIEANSAFLRIFGMANLQAAKESNVSAVLHAPSDDLDDTPLREQIVVRVHGQRRRLRLTRLMMVGSDGALIVDGLVEEMEAPPPQEESSSASTEEAAPSAPTEDRANEPGDQAPQRTPARRPKSAPEASPTSPGNRQLAPVNAVVDLDEVFDRVARELRDPIERTSAQLRCSPLPRVHGNRQQLEILFHNLLENAIRFRSHAPPVISVGAQIGEDDVRIRIRDNGIGMSPEKLHRILYERSPGPDVERWSPLGLAISRRIVEHHGGRLEATSSPGRGTIFFFSLRRAIEDQAGELSS